VGVVAGSSVLGMLIPPSLLMILYGFLSNQSVGDLFTAGIVPGLVLALGFSLAILLMAWLRPGMVYRDGQARPIHDEDLMPLRVMLAKLVPIVLLIASVLGGIYAGIFTATEAGAVGALMALADRGCCGASSTGAACGVCSTETGHVTVAVSFLIICANVYTRMLAMSGTPQAMVEWMAARPAWAWRPSWLLYLGLILLLGTIIDSSSILLIVLPLMLPIAQQFNLDLIWFGVITVVAVEDGPAVTALRAQRLRHQEHARRHSGHLAGRHLPRHRALHADHAGRAGAAGGIPPTQPGAPEVNAANPLDGFAVDRTAIAYVGNDLQRPECILAERDGTLWAADARGGVTRIAADGSQRYIGQRSDARFAAAAGAEALDFEARFTQGTLPNGLAFAANGDILVSNFGTDRLELMTRDGDTRTLYDRIDGLPIGKVNFVLRDSRNRIWLTVSTRVNPWTAAAASPVRDGYVALADPNTACVWWPTASTSPTRVRLDAHEEWLYIVETTGPHVTRMRLDESAASGVQLVDREVFGPSHLGGLPGRHRLRQFRQPLVHPRHGRPADRADTAGRQAPVARRRRPRGQRQPVAAHGRRHRAHRRHAACARHASRRGWPASPSAAPTCAPSTWAACAARASRISALRWPGCPWCTGEPPALTFAKGHAMTRKFVDLSIYLDNDTSATRRAMRPRSSTWPTKNTFAQIAPFFPGLKKEDLPDGEGWAVELVQLSTHNGTHLDAPYHFHSTMNKKLGESERAISIDEVPLEWCFQPGVKLDFRHLPTATWSRPPTWRPSSAHRPQLRPLEIVVVNTSAGKRYGQNDYVASGCGMGYEATMYLLERGVRLTGTDAWSWDAPFVHTAQKYGASHDASLIWEGHKAGRDIGYCHLEKLHNLEALPADGFFISCFPHKIRGASAGWTRAVAIFDDALQATAA
jgi:kynurenine formamidase/sugar lactone lactonase YvrE